MKLILISDTHGKHDQIKVPDGDVLVFAGDMTMAGGTKEYKSFATWLFQQPHKHIVCIAGNHDFNIGFWKTEIMPHVRPNICYLEDSEVTIDGVKFYGSPVTPRYGMWAFMLDRDSKEIRERWNEIPEDTDVLITHGPPYGILDQSAPHLHGEHLGCEELLKRLFELSKLKLHVFGHIHGSHGRESYEVRRRWMEHITFANASVLDEAYNVHSGVIQEVEI